MRHRHVSLPREHGGYLTVAGAALAAVLVAPEPQVALWIGLAITAAFLARGALDRLAAGARLRSWDPAVGAILTLVVASGVLVAWTRGGAYGIATALACTGIVTASVLARRARRQRDGRFELLGMAALGASGGIAALAAGTTSTLAMGVGLVLGAHAALSVPLVRPQVRASEWEPGSRSLATSTATLLATGGAVVLLGAPALLLGLLPRAGQLGMRALLGVFPAGAAEVGVRETIRLVAVIALVRIAIA